MLLYSKQAVWVTKFLYELYVSRDLISKDGLLTFTENQNAIAIAKGTYSPKTKHVYVENFVENRRINLKYIPTNNMLADILTKLLPFKEKPLCKKLFETKLVRSDNLDGQSVVSHS